MYATVRTEEIIAVLRESLSDVTHNSKPNGWHEFQGTSDLGGDQIQIRVILPPDFPYSLPLIYLDPWDSLGRIPHVMDDGLICFLSPEGTVTDSTRQGGIVRESLFRAIDVLEAGTSGRNREEFIEEFQAHWRRLDSDIEVRFLFNPSEHAKVLNIFEEKNGRLWIGDFPSDFDRFSPYLPLEGSDRGRRALYLPLNTGLTIDPPWKDQPFWGTEEFKVNILNNLNEPTKSRIRNLRQATQSDELWVVVGIPRKVRGWVLVGIKFCELNRFNHPLLEDSKPSTMLSFDVERVDQEALISRAGGHSSLSAAKALIVGAGAVGSRVCFELAQAGIRNLTVVDHDTFQPENTFRHHLGKRLWGHNKAEAVSIGMAADLPYIKVTPIGVPIQDAIHAKEVRPEDYDLIVFALGSPTIELAMNEYLMSTTIDKPVLFTWVEPLGIGGHALLVRTGHPGCFRCLYEDSNDPGLHFRNRASFSAPGQKFGRDLTGCGSLYTPYGSIDAARTALLAVQLGLDSITGKEQGSPLRSWKGDSHEFASEGYVVSHRYGSSMDDLERQQYAYRNEACSICGRFSSKVLSND